MKYLALNAEFNGVRLDPLGSRSPPYERIKFAYPLQNVRFLLLSTNGQIPLDGPDRTGLDPTRQVFASRVSDKVSDIVCFLLNSTTLARPDFCRRLS